MARQVNTEAAANGNTKDQLKAGVHRFKLTDFSFEVSKAGQLMFVPSLTALKDPDDLESLDTSFAGTQKTWIMLPALEDAEKWDEAFQEKREKGDKGVADFDTAKTYWDASEARCYSYFGKTVRTARALFGEDMVPVAPTYNKKQKVFLDHHGNAFSTEEVEEIRRNASVKGIEAFYALEDGELTLGDTYLYGVVKEQMYNGQPQTSIAALAHEPLEDRSSDKE